MTLHTWFKSLCAFRSTPSPREVARRTRRLRVRPMLELLEARLAPSTTTGNGSSLSASIVSSLHAQEGTAVSGLVATFHTPDSAVAASQFSASLDWGDGHVTSGTITKVRGIGLGSFFNVNGSNTYAEEGTVTVKVTVTDRAGPSTSASRSLTVADAPLHIDSITPLSAVEGSPITSAVIARFTDADPNGTASDYTAQITWGDGTNSAGSVVADPSIAGTFDVLGSHTYAEEGQSLPFSVTVNDAGGAHASVGQPITVADAPLSGSVSFSPTENTPFTGVVATFTDADPAAPLTDYSATIHWGDGLTTTGALAIVPNGTDRTHPAATVYSVTGGHTYARDGQFTVSVQVHDRGGSHVELRAEVPVADAPIQVPAQQALHSVEGSALGAGSSATGLPDVAFFTDPGDPRGRPADYTASIDWGDGTPVTTGIVVVQKAQLVKAHSGNPVHISAGFAVQGSHTYAEEGDFTIHVTVTPTGGAGSIIINTAQVADAPLLPLGLNRTRPQLTKQTSDPSLSATEGAAMPQTQLVAFVDTDPAGVVDDYSAAIDWGDGQFSRGVIQGINGTGPAANQLDHLVVLGSNTYAEEGRYTITVTIFDAQESSVAQPLVLHKNIVVQDRPLQAVANPDVRAVEGNRLDQVVASFIDASPAPATEYSAQINYGDGTSDTGQVVADNDTATLFHVFAPQTSTHGYREGDFDLQVTVGDPGGSQLLTHTTVHVSDAPLTLQDANPLTEIALQPFTATLGTYVDGSTQTLVHDTDATVSIDWGDGMTSKGSVADNGDGTFRVVGSHKYQAQTNDAPEAISVTVQDPGGQSLTFTNSATVQNTAAALPPFLQAQAAALQEALDQQVLSSLLPLVGNALATNAVGQFVSIFAQPLFTAAQAGGGGDLNALHNALVADLGSHGAKLLNNDNQVTVTADDHGGFTVEVTLHEDQTLNTGRVDLNLGLPGLPLQFVTQNLGVSVQLGFDLDLQFGVQDDGTLFLQTKANASNTSNPQGFDIHLTAQLESGSTISASIGGVNATVNQAANLPASIFTGAISLGFASNLSTGAVQLASPLLSANATVNVNAALAFGTEVSQPETQLPSFTAGLAVNWGIKNADLTSGKPLGTATATFSNVTVNLGSFLSDIATPVVQAIQPFTKPLEPLAEFLTSPVPLLSDVTDKLGIQPVTYGDLIGLATTKKLNTIAKAIETINNFQFTGVDASVNVGTITVTKAQAPGSPLAHFVAGASQGSGFFAKVNPKAKGFFTDLTANASFDFPIVDNPGAFLTGLFLGEHVDLVKVNMTLDATVGYNIKYPIAGIPFIGSLNANVFGSFDLHAGGIFVLSNDGPLSGNPLDSLIVQNAHFDLRFTMGGGLSVTVLFATATLDAELSLAFDLALRDKGSHNNTFTGTDISDGNVDLVVNAPQVQGSLEFLVQVFGGTVFDASLPVFTLTL
jgi:hypothetical protein